MTIEHVSSFPALPDPPDDTVSPEVLEFVRDLLHQEFGHLDLSENEVLLVAVEVEGFLAAADARRAGAR